MEAKARRKEVLDMMLNKQWEQAWRNGDTRPLIAYDENYEYRLRCVFKNGAYKVDLAKVEPVSGKEIGIVGSVSEYASAAGAHEVIVSWGEKFAKDWIAENGL